VLIELYLLVIAYIVSWLLPIACCLFITIHLILVVLGDQVMLQLIIEGVGVICDMLSYCCTSFSLWVL
jgi:hypothetical protein